MTPEQAEIQRLRAELERERARADGLQEIVHALTVKKRSAGAERQSRYRGRKAESVTGDVTVTHNSDASPVPSPPLDGSPPLPAPISPSPLSSPPTLFSVVSPGEPSGAAVSAKRQPTRSNALVEFIDFARAETRKHLAPDAPDNCRLEPHQAVRLGQCVKEHGLAATKAAFGLWMGWEGSRAAGYPLGMFAAKWEGWVGRVKAPGGTAAGGRPGEDERSRKLRETHEAMVRDGLVRP